MNASGLLILAGFALALTAHFFPFQPASQVQVPFGTLHVPWLQSGSSLHAQVLQSMPPKLALQLHSPPEHSPLPLHGVPGVFVGHGCSFKKET